MTIQTNIEAEPQILALYRAMDDITRHKVLQLLVREFDYGWDEFDIALSAAATELHPNREDLQDTLYPIGRLNMEASRRHRMSLERDVLTAERYAAGRIAMMHARTEPMPGVAAAWRAIR